MSYGDMKGVMAETEQFLAAANHETADSGARHALVLKKNGQAAHFPPVADGLEYEFFKTGLPVAYVRLRLDHESRSLEVEADDARQAEALSDLLKKELEKHRTIFGGPMFCLVIFMMFAVVIPSVVYFLVYQEFVRPSRYHFFGFGIILYQSGLAAFFAWTGFFARFFPGFSLFDDQISFLERHSAEITFASLMTALTAFTVSLLLFWRTRRPGRRPVNGVH